MSGRYKAVPTGTIANGKPVLVNSTGTVSEISATANSVAQSIGTPANYSGTGLKSATSVAYDSNSNRVVFAYADQDNSHYGTAVVGTVDPSDNSMSFGSAVVFQSNNISFSSITFDSNSNKIVIAYSYSGGRAIVGTVDPADNSISFGSNTQFESGTTDYPKAVFDSNSNKVVILYSDASDSDKGKGIVGTVSGTSISFGSIAEFFGSASKYIASVFDTSNNKVVFGYEAYSGGSHLYGQVGTVSSTSISFGTATQLRSSSGVKYVGAAFDSNRNKIVFAYEDVAESQRGYATVATVSGTSISGHHNKNSAGVLYDNSNTEFHVATFDSNFNKVVVAYKDNGNSGYGTFVVGSIDASGDITFGTSVVYTSSSVQHSLTSSAMVFDSTNNRVVIHFEDAINESGVGNGKYVVITVAGSSTNLSASTSEGYIGLSNSCSFHGATETYTVTVASGALYGGGTGNVFYLNGLSNPPIQLLKGHTYIFDQADSSNSGHPLHFKDTGGSQYTSGVTVTGTAGQAGAKVTIVVPIDATEPSQYYCTAHGNGMGNLVTIEESFAEIDVVGTVNKHQSGLTAGQTYFVQTDGTLGTSADDPSVVAGTAISATEIIVKG